MATVLKDQQVNEIEGVDLEPYRGRWVAVRNKVVIASELDAAALRAHPEVTPTDFITLVPEIGSGLNLL